MPESGPLEDFRTGTLRLARVLGVGGLAGAVAGLVLVAAAPSGYGGGVALTVLVVLVLAACCLAMIFTSSQTHAATPRNAARARNVVVAACFALALLALTAATYPSAFSTTKCFAAYQDRSNPILEEDTGACLDALPTISGISRVTMALALLTLIYGWYVAYRYIKLRRAQFGPAPTTDGAGPPVVPSQPAPGIAAELDQLARLHRDGAINDDEFDAAKKRLLGT